MFSDSMTRSLRQAHQAEKLNTKHKHLHRTKSLPKITAWICGGCGASIAQDKPRRHLPRRCRIASQTVTATNTTLINSTHQPATAVTSYHMKLCWTRAVAARTQWVAQTPRVSTNATPQAPLTCSCGSTYTADGTGLGTST
jgi:hypothetical protein